MGRHKKKRKKKNLPWYYMDKTGRLKGQPPKERAIGYCHNPTHRGYLSLKVYKQHRCNIKECRYYEKYDEHPYWQQKKHIKELKKKKKNGDNDDFRLDSQDNN